jgi:hypothetical protein
MGRRHGSLMEQSDWSEHSRRKALIGCGLVLGVFLAAGAFFLWLWMNTHL